MKEFWPRCGHLKTPENTAPNGKRVCCRQCRRTRSSKHYRLSPQHESYEAGILRRQAEMTLLDKMLAEASMPEWYPHG